MTVNREFDFRAIIDNFDQPCYIVDPKTHEILYANKILQEIYQDPLVGKICYESFQGLGSPCSFCTNDKLFRDMPTSPYIWEHYNEKLDMWFRCFDYAIDWSEGKKVRFEIATDITEQKKAELALIEERNNIQEYLDIAAVMIIILNEKGEVTLINKKGCEILEYSHEEIIGKDWFDNFLPEGMRTEVKTLFRKIMKGELEYGEYHENIILAKTGKEKVIAWHNTLMKNDSGETIGTLSSGEDITDRRKAEQQLKESEEKYKMLAGVTSDYIYEWDIKTDRLEWFGGFDEALGYKKDEIPRTIEGWVSKIHPDDQKKMKNSVEIHRKSTEPIYEEYKIQAKDGKWCYWIDYGVPIVKDDIPVKWLGGCKDITERKIAKKRLKESEEKYREAFNQTDFYKDLLAHDIGNILNNIQSSVELYRIWEEDEAKKEDRREMIKIIERQVGRGASLISNVRRLTEVERANLVIKSIEVKALLEDAIKPIVGKFNDKEVNLNIEASQNMFNVRGGAFLIDVFDNLLRNGVIHNDNDRVGLKIKLSGIQKNDENFVKIEFIDNGRGISDPRKKSIFERDYQKDRSTGGLGIGLSLVKKIVGLYGGQIWVEDRIPGDYTQGSNFIVLLKEMN